jgi:hypothetical protein
MRKPTWKRLILETSKELPSFIKNSNLLPNGAIDNQKLWKRLDEIFNKPPEKVDWQNNPFTKLKNLWEKVDAIRAMPSPIRHYAQTNQEIIDDKTLLEIRGGGYSLN